jgi:uncharacterized membrane protein YqjE
MTTPPPAGNSTPPDAPSALSGLTQSLRGLGATLLAILQTRLDLLATELEQEKRRLLRVMAWGAVAVFLGCAGVVFLAALVTVLMWDQHRVLVLCVLTLSFWLGCGGILWWMRTRLQAPTDWLAGTLAELELDRHALQGPEPALAAPHPAPSQNEAPSCP